MTKAPANAQFRKTGEAKADRNGRPTSKPSNLTKKTRLIILLSKNTGSDITSISKRFGWLPHTTRAALSRLRKAGYDEITSVKAGTGKPTKYRITSAPAEQSAQ